MRAGFPHSDIPGSKLACQLPEAYRRLQRPSSPVVAKASTTCTFSLDPITLSAARAVSAVIEALGCIAATQPQMQVMQFHTQMSPAQKYEPDSPCFFRIVKEQPKHKRNQQRCGHVLKIQEGWWSQPGSNR